MQGDTRKALSLQMPARGCMVTLQQSLGDYASWSQSDVLPDTSTTMAMWGGAPPGGRPTCAGSVGRLSLPLSPSLNANTEQQELQRWPASQQQVRAFARPCLSASLWR